MKMNCMNTCAISIILNLTILLTYSYKANAQEYTFQAIQERFDKGEIFRSEIKHVYTDSFTENETESYGSLWISIDSYKIETSDQIILVHEGLSRVYNRHQNRVIISTYRPDEDDFAPSRFFRVDEERFSVTERTTEDKGTEVSIRFLDPFDVLSDAVVRISRTGIPVEITAEDQAGNTMVSTFRFGRFLQPDIRIFTLQYPPDAEIIDLRD